DWNTLIVGKLSEWIKADSEIPPIRKTSEAALLQELNFSAYLGLPAFLIPLTQKENSNLARLLLNHIHTGHHSTMFWMRVPLMASNDLREDLIENEPLQNCDGDDKVEEERTWIWWHNFRTLCDYNKKIALAIEVGADLPGSNVIDRWLGEPIKAAILPTSIFLTNKKGFPVLSKIHQRLIFRLFKLEVQFVISGSHHHSEKDFCSYLQYLEYLSQNRPPPNAYEMFAKGYEDYLQSPLQPLMDNLESQTYEVFEKDPVKYSQYQQAVYKCLLDRVPEEEKETNTQILMVLGAGRGPLVNASIRAAKQAERLIKVYAVEKNPNAVITIPGEYTSYLAPISSSKLYNEVRACREKDRDPEAQFEMPYVVRLHNFHQLSSPLPCFTFQHPNKDPVIDNNRYCCLKYDIKLNTVLHGFAGYFRTVLYQDVTLSQYLIFSA
ncbi:hypothetical protein GDO78_007037, partial [Eleutherodactylus coqui]